VRNSVDYIYDKISGKHNIPKEYVEKAIMDLWKSVKTEMSSKKGKDILLPYWGSIYIENYVLNAVLKEFPEQTYKLEERFRNGELDWTTYMFKWRDLERYKNTYLKII
jgi:hypothetical protein